MTEDCVSTMSDVDNDLVLPKATMEVHNQEEAKAKAQQIHGAVAANNDIKASNGPQGNVTDHSPQLSKQSTNLAGNLAGSIRGRPKTQKRQCSHSFLEDK